MKKIFFLMITLLFSFQFVNAQNNCLDFDGTDDYVDIGIGPSTVQTVELWINPASTSEYCIDLNGSAYIWVSTGTLTATGFTSPTIYVNGVASTAISLNEWQHIAVTTSTGINASNFDIGRKTTDYFDGKIDEVKLWDDVRTKAEIRASMYQELEGNESGLVAYYKFNESSLTNANDDQSSSNYDGTLTNMTGSEWTPSSAFFGPK
ncbi:MAG: LamG domain-containing protein, partial [Bacteroidota bacterium]|nr:LamG domain-containing protein [Bacteroidota bacterium]